MRWDTTAISQGSLVEQPTTNATFNSSFTTWLVMILIYWLRISARLKETLNIFQIMRKITSVLAKMLLLTALNYLLLLPSIVKSQTWVMISLRKPWETSKVKSTWSRRKVCTHMITRAALKSSMQQNCHPKKSSTLSGTTVISDEDYEHAKKVWKEFDMKAIGNYHDHYLKTDVRLPADVFEEFRKVCHENYKLDSV